MAVTVQRGTKTLASGNASMTIVQGTDPGFTATVTKARTRLRITSRTAGTNVSTYTNYSVAATLTDGNTITVTRSGTDADVIVEWELTEFESGQLVAQYVTLTLAAVTTQTAAINAASISGGRWIEYLGMVTAQENAQRCTGNLVFDSDTQISFTRNLSTGTVIVEAVVYEHVAATVQTVNDTLTTSTLTDSDATISAVTVAKTIVTGTVRHNTSLDIRDGSWQAYLTSTTNLRRSRNLGTSGTCVFNIYVVSFSDDTAVQQFTVVHGDGTANPVAQAVSAVTVAETSLLLSGLMVPSLGLSSIATAFGRALSTVALTSTTNVNEQKGITATANTQYLQVIQWGALGGTSAAVTGTLATGTKTQANIVDGDDGLGNPLTIILTLTGDTWVAAGATFDAQRQAIINGLDAASSPSTGWNTLVRDTLPVTAVVRTSATVVTITLPAVPTYAITADEVITCTIPAAAVSLAAEIVASPTITIHYGVRLSAYSGTTNASGVKTTDLTSDQASVRVLTTAYVNGTVVARTTTFPA